MHRPRGHVQPNPYESRLAQYHGPPRTRSRPSTWGPRTPRLPGPGLPMNRPTGQIKRPACQPVPGSTGNRLRGSRPLVLRQQDQLVSRPNSSIRGITRHQQPRIPGNQLRQEFPGNQLRQEFPGKQPSLNSRGRYMGQRNPRATDQPRSGILPTDSRIRGPKSNVRPGWGPRVPPGNRQPRMHGQTLTPNRQGYPPAGLRTGSLSRANRPASSNQPTGGHGSYSGPDGVMQPNMPGAHQQFRQSRPFKTPQTGPRMQPPSGMHNFRSEYDEHHISEDQYANYDDEYSSQQYDPYSAEYSEEQFVDYSDQEYISPQPNSEHQVEEPMDYVEMNNEEYAGYEMNEDSNLGDVGFDQEYFPNEHGDHNVYCDPAPYQDCSEMGNTGNQFFNSDENYDDGQYDQNVYYSRNTSRRSLTGGAFEEIHSKRSHSMEGRSKEDMEEGECSNPEDDLTSSRQNRQRNVKHKFDEYLEKRTSSFKGHSRYPSGSDGSHQYRSRGPYTARQDTNRRDTSSHERSSSGRSHHDRSRREESKSLRTHSTESRSRETSRSRDSSRTADQKLSRQHSPKSSSHEQSKQSTSPTKSRTNKKPGNTSDADSDSDYEEVVHTAKDFADAVDDLLKVHRLEPNSGKEDEDEEEPAWVRSSPANVYFRFDKETHQMKATKKMIDLENRFKTELVNRGKRTRETQPVYGPEPQPVTIATHTHKHPGCHNHDSGSSSSDDDSDLEADAACEWMNELMRKKRDPARLHEEIWYNEHKQMNDGPICRCSLRSRSHGIRHDIYPGEQPIKSCDMASNNSNSLYHYRISVSPHTNFILQNPTLIEHDSHEYIFEGFSLISHKKIGDIPVCKVIRFNIEYTIHWFQEDMPENFSVRSLDLFQSYLFDEILELVDLDWRSKEEGQCNRYHIMPRFARTLPDNGKEILSMNDVLSYLLKSSELLIKENSLSDLITLSKPDWENMVDKIRGMIVCLPGRRPSAIRIDQLDRDHLEDEETYPSIVHFGIRPHQLSYAGDPNYQKLWKQYVKFKHLLSNKPKVTAEDRNKLMAKEDQLSDMRLKSTLKREVTVELNSKGFIKTGIMADICQHGLMLPVLIGHLRFHECLHVLEDRIGYKFKDRLKLQLALTHPSYRVNFGTNPDHARNSLSNCGIRLPEYGDRRIHYNTRRKRGINTLINIMSRLGRREETSSEINHYERLEFLGDAVVEFVTSIHLFFMFPSLEEGGLATYRAAIVQNQHLAYLGKKLGLHDFLLYAHGPDLCLDSDLRHAVANCVESLMGALFLDSGIELADRVFGEVLFDDSEELRKIWMNIPKHPLQLDEPNGDRHWLETSPALQRLLEFEEQTGVSFTHIRLLARSFTLRNVGYNNLTFGHNQRLEFLGDTVLQLVASEFLYKHFPEHHEGHLSLLRSCLVNNRTQAVVCDDLGMTRFMIQAEHRGPEDVSTMKHKQKADLLEAYMGALYVDKDLEYCLVFCEVCFFPRLKQFILNQDWNDPKSQLQQCCLTLREMDGGEPDIPQYKVIHSTGPTNTRKYEVAVYFRGNRLATGVGHSIQQAEMNAASNALEDNYALFPQLGYQRRVVNSKYSTKKRRPESDERSRSDSRTHDRQRSESRYRSESKSRSSDRSKYDSKSRSDKKPRIEERKSACDSKSRSSSQSRNDRSSKHIQSKEFQ